MTYNAVHLIDLENLYGSGRLSYEAIKKTRLAYLEEVGVQDGDLVLVAAGIGNRLTVSNGWPGALYKFREGLNGADIALAEFMSEFHSAHRYNRAFLGSGDGGLAPYAEFLRTSGLDIVVVARPSSTSYRLRGFERIEFPEMQFAS
jgi:hypothetical protein